MKRLTTLGSNAVQFLLDRVPGGLAAVGVLEAEAGGEFRVVDLDGRLGAAGDGAGEESGLAGGEGCHCCLFESVVLWMMCGWYVG